MRVTLSSSLLLVLLTTSCHQRSPNDQASEPTMSCEEAKQDLITTLQSLPKRSVGSAIVVGLPESTLGGGLGTGPVLEVGGDRLRLDGAEVEGSSLELQLRSVKARLAAWAEDKGEAERLTVYIAAAPDLEVRELRRALRALPKDAAARLLFRAPALSLENDRNRTGHQFSQQLLAEGDPVRREALARKGYRAFSKCDAIEEAAERAAGLSAQKRWPKLREGLLTAAPTCRCESLRAGDLKQLIVAEQRAGSIAFGSIPLSFVRDERCGASMPRRSVQKLLSQIEDFDSEFAGDWQEEGLSFDQVVTNERLLVYFCDALPGETLAALQKARATLHFRVGDARQCQAWSFAPLAPGSPMGTWKRQGDEPLSLHYWQGAEEIRFFGPAQEGSRPTDDRQWACNQNVRMESVDATSIRLENGRWFFDEASCRQASDAETMGGCVGRLSSGGSLSSEPRETSEPVAAEGQSETAMDQPGTSADQAMPAEQPSVSSRDGEHDGESATQTN